MGFLCGLWYFVRNVLKAIFVLIGILFLNLTDFTDVEMSENFGLGIFLFILFFVTVSTTYDLGGGWFLKITSGVGLGSAIFGSFLFIAASYVIMTWIAAHTALVSGLFLLSFVINQVIETVKYAGDLPKFFTITSAFCILVFIIETFCLLFQLPPLIFAFEDGSNAVFVEMLKFLTMALTVIFTFVNIIARATQAID